VEVQEERVLFVRGPKWRHKRPEEIAVPIHGCCLDA
jgi:hypothetical protein